MQRFSTVIGLWDSVRETVVGRKASVSIAALAAGWTVLLASDSHLVNWRIPVALHDDLSRVLAAASVIVVLAWLLRGPAYLSALHLGRQVERERQRTLVVSDDPGRLEEITIPIIQLPVSARPN